MESIYKMKKLKSKKLDFMGRSIFDMTKIKGGYWYSRFQRASEGRSKWRKEARYFERWYENMKYFNDEQRKDWFKTIDKLETANLKLKKAWIAWYIATILYIVGIIILI